MKKHLSFFVSVLMLSSCLSVLVSGFTPVIADENNLQIVTTIFPEYDWVLNVLGDNPAGAEVSLLLDNGVDLHSYQPTVDDIITISTCDLFIYVGGESDEWVEDTLREASNENMVVINLLDVLGDAAKTEELVPGMQESEHAHDHDHEEDAEAEDHDHEEDAEAEEHEHEENAETEEHEHEHEEELDEHVWLSLKNAVVLVDAIAEAVQSIDTDNSQLYLDNAAAYTEKLKALDEDYQSAVSEASVTTLLFGDRFPFRYMTDDYGLTYYAAFSGCSAESEASFETIVFLSQKVDELSLHTVLTIDGSDQKIAETIVQNTQSKDQQILRLDSMQSVTSDDIAEGNTYLSIMEGNLAVLKDALK